MAWVNAQLRKRPTVKLVQDLRQDLRDGVVLAHLIEIVGQFQPEPRCQGLPEHDLLSPLCILQSWSLLLSIHHVEMEQEIQINMQP